MGFGSRNFINDCIEDGTRPEDLLDYLDKPEKPKYEFVEAYTVWELVVNDRTLHLFTTKEAAEEFANHESTKIALNFLAPGAKITIHEISVMELQ